jgi:2-keto-myo-inositol isomerase
MDQRFCLNAATIKTTPLDLQIDLARNAGFHQIGLWLKDVEDATAQGRSLSEIKDQLDASGLRVAEFCFLGGWQDADEPKFKEVLIQTRRICEFSRALGCEIVVTVPALGQGWLAGAPERFRQVCQVAAESGRRIALEFPGIAAEVKDLRSAHDLISAAGRPNGGLIIDTFHFFVGGSKIEDFERIAPGEIFLVHISDAPNLPMEKLRIPHDNRTFPGEGTIDFAPIFQQLNRLQYGGAISLEIWNRELHQADPAEVVKRGCESLRRMEGLLQNHQTLTAEG